ncbi:unnamed protein product [Symbiodinium sp. CCMP2456]|nr:unnamed protein product [Symbiodinium sp. CCMP2456]
MEHPVAFGSRPWPTLPLTFRRIPRSKMHRVLQLARRGSKPIFGLGIVPPTSGTTSLQGHLRHFCSSDGPDVKDLLKSLPAAMSALRRWRAFIQVATWEQLQHKLNSAKSWLTGQGAATDKAVQDAQHKVEQNGGKIVSSESCGRRFVDHKGYQVERWHQAVDGLKQELELWDTEAAPFKNALIRDEGKGVHFIEKTSTGKRIATAYIAYRIVKHDSRIDIIYGKHEESMEVSGEATPLPTQNCIQYDGRTFSVWPPAHPHSRERGEDMEGLVVDVPGGWRVVDSSQAGFENVAKWVVAPYGWHADVLVTQGPEGIFELWKSARYGSYAGLRLDASSCPVKKIDESRYQLIHASYRLLIEALPAASPELVNNWKRYVQLSAQREWSQRLGMPLAVPRD